MNSTSIRKAPHDYFIWIYRVLFALVVPIAIWMANKPILQVNLPFLDRRLPAYHIIIASDIYMRWVDENNVTAGAVREIQDLIGHYTLTPVLADEPILENQIGPKPDLRLISNTLAIAIPANSATLLGDNLRAGDIVSIAAVPLSNTTSLPRIIFDSVLVLDVKQSLQGQAVIIIAIPDYRWSDYLVETRDAIVVLALPVE